MKVRLLRDVSPYKAGETYDLPRQRAMQLISQNFAEEDNSMLPPEVKEKGGGWYELPNGDKVRGKDKVLREKSSGR